MMTTTYRLIAVFALALVLSVGCKRGSNPDSPGGAVGPYVVRPDGPDGPVRT